MRGIKGYAEDTYKESKTFKEGKGIIEFKNTRIVEIDGKKTPFDFQYFLFEK